MNYSYKNKVLLIIIVLLSVIPVINCSKLKTENKQQSINDSSRETIVSYMSQPTFINKDFTQQITGTNAKLHIYNVDEAELYFSIDKKDFDSLSTISSLTVNPSKVEYGHEENGWSRLGKYTLKNPDKLFFRFPVNDFKVDTSKVITIDFGKYKYTVTVNELTDFSNEKTVFGGKVETATGKNIYMANHGVLVGIKGEPSLKRLAEQIVGTETNREKIAQMLLDFVAFNIEFSESEAAGTYEVLKRPNEVLMTRTSDCSGLTVLYASLLEQYDIDYRLVYLPHHICVAVEGNFPGTNSLNFEYEDKTFSIAETTVKGFEIGRTRLLQEFSPGKIKYIQKPGRDSTIIKFSTRKPLEN